MATLASLAAAVVAAVFVAWQPGEEGEPLPAVTKGRQTAAVQHDSREISETETLEPKFSVLSYRRALTRSPEDFDALLVRDAAARPASAQPFQFAYGSPVTTPLSLEGDF